MTDSIKPTGSEPSRGAIGEHSHQELLAFAAETAVSARRRYGLPARLLFFLLDAVYGKTRTLSKFKVLELVARVPYQAWEQVAYIAITHTSRRPEFARRVFDRVAEHRRQEDNEQWHLLILEELIADQEIEEGRVRFVVVPQLLAFVYYQLSFLLYVMRPEWSYRLNADFEDHAEHEYVSLVAEHPLWQHEPFTSAFAKDYGEFATLADVFRQISYDERMHKEASEAAMARARFT